MDYDSPAFKLVQKIGIKGMELPKKKRYTSFSLEDSKIIVLEVLKFLEKSECTVSELRKDVEELSY